MSVWAGAQTLRSFGVLPLTTWIYRPSAASTLPICGEHRWGLPCTAYLRPELTHPILSMARRGVTPGSSFHGPGGSRPVPGPISAGAAETRAGERKRGAHVTRGPHFDRVVS